MRTLNKGMAARYQQENHVTRYPVILYRSVLTTLRHHFVQRPHAQCKFNCFNPTARACYVTFARQCNTTMYMRLCNGGTSMQCACGRWTKEWRHVISKKTTWPAIQLYYGAYPHELVPTTCLHSRYQNNRPQSLAVTRQRVIVASYWEDTMCFSHRLFFIWLRYFNQPNTTSTNFDRHEIICIGNMVQSN